MVSLSGTNAFLGAIRSGRRVYLAAYFLHPGRVLDALEGAARNGGRITVRLEGHPFDDASGSIRRTNAAAVGRLRAAGADAALSESSPGEFHIKAAVIDGVAYLDDRNFNVRGDTIVRDDSRRDVAALKAALTGRPFPLGKRFWTNKADALAGEARLLGTAAHARKVDVQTESFSSFNAVCRALRRLAAVGVRCRLIVTSQTMNTKERRALCWLQGLGVEVRAANSNEKMAVVDGRRAWVGSSNATSTYYDAAQKDWGLRTDTRDVARDLERRFQANWKSSTAFRVV